MSLKKSNVNEIIACGKNASYFINKYIMIQHPIKGDVAFNTFPFQDDCLEQFIEHRLNVVLKARQLGLSTLVSAYALWLAIFKKNQNILIIATKLDVAKNIIKKIKHMWNRLPKWLLLTECVINNTQSLEFSNGSSIKAIPTSDDAGRSEALSLLIIDEAAFIDNFDTLWTGLYPTLSTGGRAIVLSTPNGVGGQYHKLYTEAESGLNEFNAIKLMWHVHPEHDEDWFEKQKRNLSKKQLAQEHLCDFLASGDTFLDNDDLEWVKSHVKPPIEKRGGDNNLWLWYYPVKSRHYILSADVARGDGKDYSTFHVIDTETSHVVAEYKGRLPPDKFAELIDETGRYYNNALVCPENNSYGYSVCLKLSENDYPALYYSDQRSIVLGGYIPKGDVAKAGFHTSGATRPRALSKMEELIRNKTLICHSSRLIDELKTFIWTGGRAQASKESNDDLVMALAIGAWIFDTVGGSNKSSQVLAHSMLAGMAKSSHSYSQPQIKGSGADRFNFDPARVDNYGKPIIIGDDNKKDTRYVNEFDLIMKSLLK